MSATSATGALRAVFIDANPTLGAVAERLHTSSDFKLVVNGQPDITSADIPAVLGDAQVAIIDHTHLPTDIARQCKGLKHVVFLGTGPRSYMNPEELAELGITVHIIKGYGDTAVAECAFSLMWASAKGFAKMDRGMRAGSAGRRETCKRFARGLRALPTRTCFVYAARSGAILSHRFGCRHDASPGTKPGQGRLTAFSRFRRESEAGAVRNNRS